MIAMNNCTVFHTQAEIDSVREFTHWLSSGGMDALRELSQLADSVKRFRQASIVALAGLAVVTVGTALGLGIIAMIGG